MMIGAPGAWSAATPHTASRPSTPTRPLDADLVVVDETSMVDVILATKLVKAVAPGDGLPCHGPLRQVSVGSAVTDLGPDRSESELPAARAVPSTRAAILAKAVSREVELSSANGEKPQSSQVPSWSAGNWRAAARIRSRTWLRGFHPRIDRVSDADEDPGAGRKMLGDDPAVPCPGRPRWRAGCRSYPPSAGTASAAARRNRHPGCGLSPDRPRGRYARRYGSLGVAEALKNLVVRGQ